MSKTLAEMQSEGGPVFPPRRNPDGNGYQDEHGISLRDHFAAKAMQAIIAKTPFVDMTKPSREMALQDEQTVNRLMATSQGAYLYADAMLAARKAGGQ